MNYPEWNEKNLLSFYSDYILIYPDVFNYGKTLTKSVKIILSNYPNWEKFYQNCISENNSEEFKKFLRIYTFNYKLKKLLE